VRHSFVAELGGDIMHLTQVLHKACRERPESIATVCGDRRRTYRQLVERVARLAGALRDLGVQPGDRVSMLSFNSDYFIEYLYGTLWSGAAVNPINIRWAAPEIAFSLHDCNTRILLVDDPFAHMIESLRLQSPGLSAVIYVGDGTAPADALDYEALLSGATPARDSMSGGRDLAAVLYTGGTTGHPKGVMLSHESLGINALATLAAAPRASPVVALHAAPLFHVAGITFVLQIGLRLARHVLMRTFDPVEALRLIEAEGVAETFMVPTMIRRLLEEEDFNHRDLSSLRTLLYGAAPIDPSLQAQLLRALPNLECTQLYGQTEAASAVTALPPEYHQLDTAYADKRGSAGRPISTAEVRIVDVTGAELPTGQVGEICLRGPTVMLGYWNQPELTAAAVRDGWLHSGDLGYLDADGFLYIVDRLKDMIISGGENVYSSEVEKALLSHREVAMCAVIGVPDERWGERVHAVVVRQADGTVTEAELTAHCKKLIAGYKCPRSMEFRDELPLSAAGKLLKHVLREPYWRDRERRIA
jgi:acyl-CoA synthetase (AMP-forming)/AMP-acid ligase II